MCELGQLTYRNWVTCSLHGYNIIANILDLGFNYNFRQINKYKMIQSIILAMEFTAEIWSLYHTCKTQPNPRLHETNKYHNYSSKNANFFLKQKKIYYLIKIKRNSTNCLGRAPDKVVDFIMLSSQKSIFHKPFYIELIYYFIQHRHWIKFPFLWDLIFLYAEKNVFSTIEEKTVSKKLCVFNTFPWLFFLIIHVRNHLPTA